MLGLKVGDDADLTGDLIVFGDTKYGRGALAVAVSRINKDNLTPEEAQEAVGAKMITIDKSYVPIFGGNLSIAKPNSNLSDTVLMKNFDELLKYKLFKTLEVNNLDFKKPTRRR